MSATTEQFTAKPARFCEEYVIDLNATQAAVRAGYAKGSAHVQASRLLSDANAKARMAELRAEVRERNDVTVDHLVAKLVELRDRAVTAGQMGPAIRAEERRGKTVAAFIDQRLCVRNYRCIRRDPGREHRQAGRRWGSRDRAPDFPWPSALAAAGRFRATARTDGPADRSAFGRCGGGALGPMAVFSRALSEPSEPFSIRYVTRAHVSVN